VIMTHNYLYDQTLLEAVLASPIAYIGLLGPKSRGEELLGNVSGASRVHSPVGLDLGSETPEQIALAVVAEIEAVLNNRTGRPLRELEGPLHVRPSVPARQ
jgi:xanthine dehydrogenase accessory factor